MTDSSSTPPPEQLSLAPIVGHPVDVSGITQSIKNIYTLARGKPDFELVQVASVQGTPPSSLTITKIGTTTQIAGVQLVGWAGSFFPIAGDYIWVFVPFPGSTPCAFGMANPQTPRIRLNLNTTFATPSTVLPGQAFAFNTAWSVNLKSGITHDFVTNNTRLTLTRGGVYTIDAGVNFAANGAGVRGIAIAFNGTVFKQEIERQPDAIFGNQLSIHLDMELNAGDWIELYYQQSSGGGLNAIAGLCTCYISVCKLADTA